MLRLTCPWCGEREESEFVGHGEACIPRPSNANKLDDRAWGEYVFFKENPKGLVYERWVHTFGCRRWFVALRDNVNDRFLGFSMPFAPLPRAPKTYRQAQACTSIPMPRTPAGYTRDRKTPRVP